MNDNDDFSPPPPPGPPSTSPVKQSTGWEIPRRPDRVIPREPTISGSTDRTRRATPMNTWIDPIELPVDSERNLRNVEPVGTRSRSTPGGSSDYGTPVRSPILSEQFAPSHRRATPEEAEMSQAKRAATNASSSWEVPAGASCSSSMAAYTRSRTTQVRSLIEGVEVKVEVKNIIGPGMKWVEVEVKVEVEVEIII